MIVLTYVKAFTFPFPLLNPVQEPHPHYTESQQVSTQSMVKTATEEAVKAHTQSTGFRFSAEGHVLETGSQVLGDSGSSGIQNDHWRAPNPRDRMLLSLLRKACAFTGGRGRQIPLCSDAFNMQEMRDGRTWPSWRRFPPGLSWDKMCEGIIRISRGL